MQPNNHSLQRAFATHDRSWRDFTYVYAVISRRSRGLSVGINLNIDQVCNFDCVYCQVYRQPPAGAIVRPAAVDLDKLGVELRQILGHVVDGSIWREPEFAEVDGAYRRLNDIAFSGDGEPTAYPRFEEACRVVADIKQSFGLRNVRIVLITNATLLDRAAVRAGLSVLDASQGEIWAKLDAGTQTYYERVDRSAVPLAKVLSNILACGRDRPIVIQTMLLRLHGESMPTPEFAAYIDRLRELREAGCQIDRIQLYTVARATAEPFATAVDAAAMDAYARALQKGLEGIPVEVFSPPEQSPE